jgi:hypothetical protein
VRTWRLPREEVGRAALSLGVGEVVAYSFLMLHSSILGKDPSHQEQEAFSPRFSGQAHDAASDSQAGTDVVAGGSGALVHRNRQDKDLPSS